MKRGAIIFFLLVLFFAGVGKSAAAAPQPGPSEFDGAAAYGHVEFLTRDIGPRPPGSAEEARAAQYIAAKFREYGWQVTIQEFSRVVYVDKGSLKKYSLVTSRNVIAKRQGQKPQEVVVGAHYDSADFNVPGAGDNASGVGVLLELARVLGKQELQQSYVMVAFGAEEAGLVGSRYFAENYDLANAKLMLNLDMVGAGRKISLDGGGKRSAPPWLLQLAYAAVKQNSFDPEIKRDWMLLARESSEGGTSDFSPFLDRWVPAIGLGQGGEPAKYYHQPNDTLDKVNRETLAGVGKIVLDLIAGLPADIEVPWNAGYVTLDLGFKLIIITPGVIKGFVLGSLAFGLYTLWRCRKKSWVSLAWLVPSFYALAVAGVAVGFVPLMVVSKIKGTMEPWYGLPKVYLLAHLCTSVLFVFFLGQFTPRLSKKFLPRSPEVYWAASLILVGLGTAGLAWKRWDFASYLAFWLLLIAVSRLRFGLILSLLGPLPVYWVHWQLFNSVLGTEFYRTFNAHPLEFSVIYGVLLIPVVFAVAGWRGSKVRSMPRLSPRWALLTLGCILALLLVNPAYTGGKPQIITVREEWQERRLWLSAVGTDRVAPELARSMGAQPGGKEIKVPLTGGSNPLQAKVKSTEVKMGKERMITVDFDLAYGEMPYLLKLKLRSEAPFSLVNGGDFFPAGKLGKQVKLSGEAVGGVYGLVLERTGPQPSKFRLYLKTEGQVRLTLEAQYPKQFVPKTFSLSKGMVKYENWATFVTEI